MLKKKSNQKKKATTKLFRKTSTNKQNQKSLKQIIKRWLIKKMLNQKVVWMDQKKRKQKKVGKDLRKNYPKKKIHLNRNKKI